MSKKRHIIQPKQDKPSIFLSRVYEENYPLFCFRYLSDTSISGCKDHKFFYDFLIRLHKLSELGWQKIRNTQRHGFGMESIPTDQIKPKLPACVTPEVKMLHVFRANGDNRPFVGLQIDRVFRVFFIETCFGDIYDHE